MKPFIFPLCLLAVAITSNSIVLRSPNSTQDGSSTSEELPMGATYCTSLVTPQAALIGYITVMTNEPSGNYIISTAFGADGKLVYI